MSLTHKMFTLSSTSVTEVTVPSAEERPYASMLTVSIQNLSSDKYVLLGDDSITTSSYGFRLDPGQVFSADLNPSNDLYAICDSDSCDISVMWIQS